MSPDITQIRVLCYKHLKKEASMPCKFWTSHGLSQAGDTPWDIPWDSPWDVPCMEYAMGDLMGYPMRNPMGYPMGHHMTWDIWYFPGPRPIMGPGPGAQDQGPRPMGLGKSTSSAKGSSSWGHGILLPLHFCLRNVCVMDSVTTLARATWCAFEASLDCFPWLV
jgi:hypothetical protein